MTSNLTACGGAFQERDRNTCESYGYTPGTDAFAKCMEQRDNRRQDALSKLSQNQRVNRTASKPIQTDCRRDMWGNYNCTTY